MLKGKLTKRILPVILSSGKVKLGVVVLPKPSSPSSPSTDNVSLPVKDDTSVDDCTSVDDGDSDSSNDTRNNNKEATN